MVGGGQNPKPGEITLSHRGVLFLDELPEYPRSVLEVLREPLENGFIHISRSKAQVSYPARFQLIAAMNPCPCGYHGDRRGRCTCTPNQINRYRGRISGPLLDRIDMHVQVDALPIKELQSVPDGETSEVVKHRVSAAHALQSQRQGRCNAQLTGKLLHSHCAIDSSCQSLLTMAMDKLKLSARAYDRILRLARTLADLQGLETIGTPQISEALAYRSLDRG